MSGFGGLILTNKGRALQAKVQAGAILRFNRIAIGDGNLGSQQISDLSALISEKKSLVISKLKTQSGGKAIVGGVLSNQDVAAGFYFREIGVFAQDPDAGEILYCYANAGAGAEYIPAGGGADVVEKNIDIITLTGNAANVTAEVASGIYAAAEDVGDMSTVPTTAKDAAGAITELATEADAHLADYVRQPGYGVATGAANTYAVALAPAPTAYAEGMAVSVKVNVANTGASTINVNGLGAKSISKANGSALASGNLKADSIYTLRYNGASFILQGEGGEYGTAGAGDVRAGKSIGTDAGLVPGSLPVQAGGNVVPGPNDIVKQAGIYDTPITVKGVVVPAAKVLNDTTIAGTQGTMPNRGGAHRAAKNVDGTSTAGRVYLAPDAGWYDGIYSLFADDPDFIAANFRADKNFFGLQGSIPVRDDTNGNAGAPNQHTPFQVVSGAGVVFARPNANGDNVGILYKGDDWLKLADANFIPENIVGNVFGLQGTAPPLAKGTGTLSNQTSFTVNGLRFTPTRVIFSTFKPGATYYTHVFMQIGNAVGDRVRLETIDTSTSDSVTATLLGGYPITINGGAFTVSNIDSTHTSYDWAAW